MRYLLGVVAGAVSLAAVLSLVAVLAIDRRLDASEIDEVVLRCELSGGEALRGPFVIVCVQE